MTRSPRSRPRERRGRGAGETAMSHFGALWRRSPVFKGVLVLATGLSLLLVAALSLQPSGKPPGAALPPSVAQSRFTAPASQTVAIGQRPVAAAASAAGSGGQVIAPSRPNASIAPRADTDPAATLMGKTVTGNVAAQGKSVPLPPGQWIGVAYFPAPGWAASRASLTQNNTSTRRRTGSRRRRRSGKKATGNATTSTSTRRKSPTSRSCERGRRRGIPRSGTASRELIWPYPVFPRQRG